MSLHPSDSSSFVARVEQDVARKALLVPGERVLVGLSGGVDSVVLLHLLRRLGYDVAAAHVNYGLRGADSDEDEAFVRQLCERWNIPIYLSAVDTKTAAAARKQSIQEAARDLRYAFFLRTAESEGISAVAVGHHLDDQAQTILLNLFRGAGPEGLAGMPAVRALAPSSSVQLIRPLLNVRRADIEVYARAHELEWREDASNEEAKYRRNALREEIIPRIEEHFGASATANVARSGSLLRDYLDAEFRAGLAAHFGRAAQEEEGGGGRLDLAVLRELPEVWRGRLILEALRRWLPEAPAGGALVAEIEKLRAAQVGRRIALPAGVVWRDRAALVFVPERAENEVSEPIHVQPGEMRDVGGGRLRVDLLAARPPQLDLGPDAVVVDAGRLEFPLVARRWQPGDRLRPLGMAGTKKVSDLLTEARVPPQEREAVHVVLSGEAVVWVVGQRLAEGVRVRPETERFAKITFFRHTPASVSETGATNPSVRPVP